MIALIRYLRARRRQAFEDSAPPPPLDFDDLCLDSPLVLPRARTAGAGASTTHHSALPNAAAGTAVTSQSLLHHHSLSQPQIAGKTHHIASTATAATGPGAGPAGGVAATGGALDLAALLASSGGRRPGETADDEIRRRLRFLSQTKFISCLGERAFFQVFPALIKIKLIPGQSLFEVGADINDGMYVVSKGALAIYTPVCVICCLSLLLCRAAALLLLLVADGLVVIAGRSNSDVCIYGG